MRKSVFIIIAIVGICLLAFFAINSIWQYPVYDKVKTEFALAREEFEASIEETRIDCVLDIDYVESADATVDYKYDYDKDRGKLRQENIIQINVHMNDDFRYLDVMDKCKMLVFIVNELDQNGPDFKAIYENSSYFQIYSKHRENLFMDLGDYKLRMSSGIAYSFDDSVYDYSLTENRMEMVKRVNNFTRTFDYTSQDGLLLSFEEYHKPVYNETHVNSFDQSGNKTGGNSSDKSSGQKGTNKSGNTNKSDPYDGDKYKSSQDFADDKYEEFYDYEDEYEDEDEAYDAAEDYWNDEYD